MININELRIGNYVLADNARVFNKKYNGTFDKVTIDILLSMSRNNDYYSPIPLTAEILLKCGFYKWNNPSENLHLEINDGAKEGFRFDLDFIYPEKKLYLKSRYDQEVKHIQECNNIKYVHQLQNMYFFLTGKELQINLPISNL